MAKIIKPAMAREIGEAVSLFGGEMTGHEPKWVTVVLSAEVAVATLHDGLPPVEHARSRIPEGAAAVRDGHRKRFETASSRLRDKIQRITGFRLRRATSEVEPDTNTIVQVFLFAGDLPTETWIGAPASGPRESRVVLE